MKTTGVNGRRAISYIRFSTPRQQHGFSLARQLERTQQFCRHHNLLLDESLTIKDLGKSAFKGENADTGNLAVFLEAVRKGKIRKGTVLVVEALDRLTRNNIVEASHLLTDILRNGIDVGMVTEDKVYSYDYINKNPFEFIVATTYLIRGGDESRMKSDRVKDAWARKKQLIAKEKRAVKIPTPCWLRRDGDKWVVIKEKANIVRKIFADYLSNGLGIWMLSHSLNANKVPLITHRGPKGTTWHRITIHRILTDKSTIGTYTLVDPPVENYFPPVVSERDFYAVQAKLKARRQFRGRHSLKDISLFKGLCKCGKCGATMTRITRTRPTADGGKKLHRYLYCHGSIAGVCKPTKCVNLTQLERVFAEKALMHPTALRMFSQDGRENDTQKELAQIDGKISDRTARRNRLVAAIEEGDDKNPRTLLDRIKVLEGELKELEQKKETTLAELHRNKDNASAIHDLHEAAVAVFRKDSQEAKLKLREFIRQFITDMTVFPEEKKLVYTTISGKTRELTWEKSAA